MPLLRQELVGTDQFLRLPKNHRSMTNLAWLDEAHSRIQMSAFRQYSRLTLVTELHKSSKNGQENKRTRVINPRPVFS
jgi:hypothetical protein